MKLGAQLVHCAAIMKQHAKKNTIHTSYYSFAIGVYLFLKPTTEGVKNV